MKLKTIGKSGISTPPIMFGGNVFGWTLDEKQSFRMLDILLERGYTFIDTANSYGKETGLSEKIIGKWMKERKVRDQITIATKAGNVHTKKSDGSIERSRNNRKEYMIKCLEDSLDRLQTDYVDLFYTHFDDKTTPLEEVLQAHQKLIDEGKTRIIGASNYSPTRLKEVLKLGEETELPKYEVLQTEYSLVEREEFENHLRKICKDYEIGVASYFSLASGFLTGKYRKKEDFKGTARQMLTEKYFDEKGLQILEKLDMLSLEHNVSPAAISLTWILQRPGITTCIASATQEKHLDAFDQALNLQLSDDEMDLLNKVSG